MVLKFTRDVLLILLNCFFLVLFITIINLLNDSIFINAFLNQLNLILLYILLTILLTKYLKFNLIKSIKNNINEITYNVFLFFSIFTVVYFVFEKLNLIEIILINFNTKQSIIYFFLLPIELIIFSILEELFFRKHLFNLIRNYSGTFKLILTSIMFAFCHLPKELISFSLLFFSSIIYGYIYLKSKKIELSISLHIATNLAVLFFGLHNESNFIDVIHTKSSLNLFDNKLKVWDIIILTSEILIFISFYYFNKTNHKTFK